MATLAEIEQRHREKHAPLFNRAKAEVRRMSAAIALGTIHARRLRSLRAGLRHGIVCNDAALLTAWLSEFGAAVEAECRAAHSSVELGSVAA